MCRAMSVKILLDAGMHALRARAFDADPAYDLN
jgi:hypothetical protein